MSDLPTIQQFIAAYAPVVIADGLLRHDWKVGSMVRTIFDLGREYGRQEVGRMKTIEELAEQLREAQPHVGQPINDVHRNVVTATLRIAEALLVELEKIRGCDRADHPDCRASREMALRCALDRERLEAANKERGP